MLAARTIFFLIFILISKGLARDDCQRYRDSMIKYKEYEAALDSTNDQENEQIYKKFREESASAARYYQSCSDLNPVADSSKESLLRSYKLAKLYIDARSCPDAAPYLEKCFQHPQTQNTKLGDTPIEIFLKGMDYDCRQPSADGGEIIYRVTGEVKGNYLRKTIGARQTKLRPYTSSEIETFCVRVFEIDRSQAALETYRKLSPTGTALYVTPFMLVAGPGAYPGYATQPQKRIHSEEEHSGDPEKNSLETIYRSIVEPTTNRLYETLFDHKPRYIIPIYLAGGSINEGDYQQYSNYCNTIHNRPAGARVGYHLPFDNSVMIWLATGGGTLNHELVHALMAADYPDAPGWLSEGIASMNEELGKNAEPLDNYRLFYIRAAYDRFNRFISLEKLIGLPGQEFSSTQTAMLHSAYARYFSMYLKNKKVLSRIYKDIRSLSELNVSSQKELLEKHLAKSLQDIQTDWQNWVLNKPLAYKWISLQPDAEYYVDQLESIDWE